MEENQEPKFKTATATPTKKNNNLLNWFVPLFLIAVGIATLIFYPAPEPVKQVAKPHKPAHKALSSNEIARSLVSSFFNGSDEDKTEQIFALENTVDHLNNNATEHTKKILDDLKNNNLSGAIQSLIADANGQSNPSESSKIWVHIGNIQNLTSTKQALQAYIKASNQDPDNSNAWNRQGHVYRQLKQFTKAESAYKKVKALDSQSTTNQALYLMNLGLLSQSKGNTKEAEKSFLEALEIYTTFENDKGILSTSENLASIYKNTKKYKKAETHYLIALKVHQKNEQSKEAIAAYSALGSLYQIMGKTDKAQIQYEKALEISLNNSFEDQLPKLYNNLGLLAEKNGDPELAKSYLEKSLLINTSIGTNAARTVNTANQLANLATVNRKKKKYDTAEEFYIKAIEIYAENNHVNGINSQKINLGFLYKAWGKPTKACEVWRGSLGLLHKHRDKRFTQIQKLIRTSCF